MTHVAPHRLADAASGRLAPPEAAELATHLEGCERCRIAMERVRAARRALAEIGAEEPHGLRWDHIAARIHWSVSSERRRRDRARMNHGHWRWAWALGCAAAVAGLAVAAFGPAGGGAPQAPAPVAEVAGAPADAAGPPPIEGVVTLVQGEVVGRMDAVLRAGSTLATGRDGRVAVQFGVDSGFALGPNSSVRVVALDVQRIQLEIEGRIDVRVSERAPGQHFGVIAGSHEVVVRGTVFRVEHDAGELAVACTRGRVEVVGADTAIAVRAGEHLQLFDGIGRPEAIHEQELSALYQSIAIPLMPVWSGAREALDVASLVALDAAPGELVTIDGVVVGPGSALFRLTPGRHRVARGAEPVRWLDLREGEDMLRLPHVERPDPREERSERAPQLARALREREHAIRACGASLAKRGVAGGGFTVLELALDSAGRQRYLNVIDTNLPAAVSACVRDVVADIVFPPGRAERVRKRVTF
jgi:hypothetical protein